jgi:hypothetical protein
VCDGYSVRLCEDEDAHRVLLLLRGAGQEVYSRLVFVASGSVAGLAAARREYWLWLAVAHYLNAGGDLDSFLGHAGFARHDPLLPPEGYQLLDTQPTEHAFEVFEHTFSNAHAQALVWTEGVGLHRAPLTALVNELAVDPAEES